MGIEWELPSPPELEVGECGGVGHIGYRGHHCWSQLKRKQGRPGGRAAREEAENLHVRIEGDASMDLACEGV